MKHKTFKIENFSERPFLVFAPFLIFMLVFVLIFDDINLYGDEDKYLNLAQNLVNGFYSPPAPDMYLGVGPGYPLLLMPFVALKLPLIFITLLNAVFYYLSIVLMYKSLRMFAVKKISILVSLCWALYYNLYENIPSILPETFAPFLVSLFMYLLIKSFDSDMKILNKYVILAGIVFGYIALTKIIFGYVMLFMLAGNALLLLLSKTNVNYRKSVIVFSVALLTTLPYLIYTYHLTGKAFYWGSTAGNNMYWMSSPYEEEYGNWFPAPNLVTDSSIQLKSLAEFRHIEHSNIKSLKNNIPGADEYIRSNHQKDFDIINKYSGVEQDSVFKSLTLNNIKSHPGKYIRNCFSNVGRILFNYPYSYKLQKPGTLLRFPLNGIISLFLLFSLIPTFLNWKRISYPIRFSIFILLLYFGASITGSAETRMFNVMVPVLLIWITFVMQKTLRIYWKFDEENGALKEKKP